MNWSQQLPMASTSPAALLSMWWAFPLCPSRDTAPSTFGEYSLFLKTMVVSLQESVEVQSFLHYPFPALFLYSHSPGNACNSVEMLILTAVTESVYI